MRHVAVMTATGSIGLIAIFAVDVLSLFWVSRLGDQSYKAAIGYASQASFLLMSVNIGLTIAISATVSRALGAGDRPRARRLAASGLTITFVAPRRPVRCCCGSSATRCSTRADARAGARRRRSRAACWRSSSPPTSRWASAWRFPACCARRATRGARCTSTLSGGIVTAFTDPLLIFGFGLGVYGAAWATVISRLVFLARRPERRGPRPRSRRACPRLSAIRRDFTPIMGIGLPAIMANLATPVAAIYVTRVWSDFGEATVAGGAIVDRVIPLAFGVIFALTGSIGPIIGQNFGARLMPRVRRALTDSFIARRRLCLGRMGACSRSAAPLIVDAVRRARRERRIRPPVLPRSARSAWVFVTCLFVANTAFNNLGFPVLAMMFNWGRATLGTIPFVTIGAHWGGVHGAMLGLDRGLGDFRPRRRRGRLQRRRSPRQGGEIGLAFAIAGATRPRREAFDEPLRHHDGRPGRAGRQQRSPTSSGFRRSRPRRRSRR